MSTEKFCLRWNNHRAELTGLLNDIYMKEKYSDGTIFCEGISYPVHSFVLSTCSKYFEEIFEKCQKGTTKHPFIVIRDINKIQLEAILSYMYKGEVIVPQKMLPDLIKAAELFKIKGLGVREHHQHREHQHKLTEEEEPVLPTICEGLKLKRSRSPSPCSDSPSIKRPKEEASNENSVNGSSDDNSNDEVALNLQMKTAFQISHSLFNNIVNSLPTSEAKLKEQGESSSTIVIKKEDDAGSDISVPMSSSDIGSLELAELDAFTMNTVTDDSFLAQKSYVPKLEVVKSDTGEVVRTYKCPFTNCLYQSSRNSDVWRHFTKHTGYKPYKCPLCRYGTNHTGHLKRHFTKAHKNVNMEAICSLGQNFKSANNDETLPS